MMMKKTGKRSPTFPKKLYHMLENAKQHGYENLISWMPGRNSFKIHVGNTKDENEKAMFVKLLKQYFNQTKYDSFLRQLMLYNFERIYKGPQRGVCKHVLFMEGRPDLFHRKSIHDFQQQTNTTRTIVPIIPMRLNNLVQPDYINSKGKDSYDEEDDEDNDDMHSQSVTSVFDEDELDLVLHDMPFSSLNDMNDIMSIVYASESNSSPQLSITELEMLLNHI